MEREPPESVVAMVPVGYAVANVVLCTAPPM